MKSIATSKPAVETAPPKCTKCPSGHFNYSRRRPTSCRSQPRIHSPGALAIPITALALVMLPGCHRNGASSGIGREGGPEGSNPQIDASKPADLSRPFSLYAWMNSPDKEPLTLARAVARATGGTWVALAPKPLEEVKGQERQPVPSQSPTAKTTDQLDKMQKAGTPVVWEARKGYMLMYFGPKLELDRFRENPPQEIVGLLVASRSAGAMVQAVSDLWKVKIEAEPELLKLREALLESRKPKGDEEDSTAQNAAMMSARGIAGEEPPPMLEFKVVEHLDPVGVIQRFAIFLGGEAQDQGGGKWKFTRLANQAKITEEILRLKRVIEERTKDAAVAFTSYASRTSNTGDAGADEEPETPIPPLDDAALEAMSGLAMLGKPAVGALTDFLNPDKPVLASAALRVLSEMKTPEAGTALVTFARDLRVRAKDNHGASLKPLATEVLKTLGRNPTRETAVVLKEFATDESFAPETRLQARLALAASGDLVQGTPGETAGDLAARELIFPLTWPAEKGATAKTAAPPPPHSIKPIATYAAAGAETWAVFVSPRYGNPDDIWLARGANGVWKEFIFTGRQFVRKNRYNGGRMGGAQPGSCTLKIEGDQVTLSPPDPKLVAEEERLRKLVEGGKLPPKDQSALYQKYSQIMSKQGSNLSTAVTLSLAALRQDTDGDGLTDIVEERLGMDANKPDTDGDGIPDGRDSNPLVAKAKSSTDHSQMLEAIFSALYAGDPSVEPIVVVLERKYWQEFSGAKSRVLCVTKEDYLQRARFLRGFRTLQFGGPKDAGATILRKEGPCLFNDSRSKAEVHFWQLRLSQSPYGRYYDIDGRMGASGSGGDYVARFEKRGDWKLVSIKRWRYDTADKATQDIQQRMTMEGAGDYP